MRIDLPALFARLSWLLYLLVSLMLYTLGTGIARYLGAQTHAGVYLLGLLWVFSMVLFTSFAHRYFDLRAAAENLGREVFNFLPWRSAMLLGVLLSATLAASAALMLIQLGVLSQSAWMLMLLIVLGACLYALPPARAADSGYGELLLSVLLGAGAPAVSFMLLFRGYHPYLAMVGFPLTALHLSMLIALSFPTYASQQKYGRKTLLVRMGWENGMMAHNLLILSAFLLIVLSAVFNFPNFAMFPTLLVLPLGLLEIYYMMRIAAGVPPNWNALAVSAAALFTLPIYILTLAFWTH